MHTINTFLYGNTGEYSQSMIFDRVRKHFSGDESAVLTIKEQPLGLSPKLKIEIGPYWMLVSVIENASIEESLQHVQAVTQQEIVTPLAPQCEIRTLFASDEDSDFDHITVDMYQFLESFPNALVYDNNHRAIISNSLFKTEEPS